MSCIRVAPALGVCLAVSLVACGDGSTSPANDPRGTMLVVSGTGSAAEIFTMRPDGSGRRQLTHNSILDNDPDWSPDGSKIVYISAVDSVPGAPARRRDVFVMNPDGSGSHRLFQPADGPGATHPRWSPDGTRISFDAFDPVRVGFEPYVMNADGSNVTLIRSMQGENFGLEWSPDGTRFVFLSNRGPRFLWTLYVMPVDGSSDQQLSGDDACNNHLGRWVQWSPNGSLIAYSCNNGFGSVIRLLLSDGTSTGVTLPSTVDFSPVWSPDGSQIVFASDRRLISPGDSIPQAFLINAGGGNLSRVTAESTRQVVNSWRVH